LVYVIIGDDFYLIEREPSGLYLLPGSYSSHKIIYMGNSRPPLIELGLKSGGYVYYWRGKNPNGDNTASTLRGFISFVSNEAITVGPSTSVQWFEDGSFNFDNGTSVSWYVTGGVAYKHKGSIPEPEQPPIPTCKKTMPDGSIFYLSGKDCEEEDDVEYV
jgi:hypothetical protein